MFHREIVHCCIIFMIVYCECFMKHCNVALRGGARAESFVCQSITNVLLQLLFGLQVKV